MGALGHIRKILGAMKKGANKRLRGNSAFSSVFLKQLTFISSAWKWMGEAGSVSAPSNLLHIFPVALKFPVNECVLSRSVSFIYYKLMQHFLQCRFDPVSNSCLHEQN